MLLSSGFLQNDINCDSPSWFGVFKGILKISPSKQISILGLDADSIPCEVKEMPLVGCSLLKLGKRTGPQSLRSSQMHSDMAAQLGQQSTWQSHSV